MHNNSSVATIKHALEYLAENDRPHGGQQRFNSEHLYQLAKESDELIPRAAVRNALAELREKLADQEILTEVWTRGMSADEGTEAIIAIVDTTATALGLDAHEGEQEASSESDDYS